MKEELFLQLKIGMTIAEVENRLNESIELEHYEKSGYSYEFIKYVEGVQLFFKGTPLLLDTIRFEAPFSHEVDGVKIGLTKNEVKKIKGTAIRKDPFPYDYPNTVWYYNSDIYNKSIRYDFEKTRNGKCIVIFL
ncbi:hypothetical protein [Breznakia pachnodae]|uniref:Uncharacterized protein n=1 Tax=Breznakia pachnodae TaxID=265178 RepID=A0ABU0E7G3_9FIRM|nr:hypothetical protein [Breznakia pachnodae]MDQ0362420.1 hypothetical protein [Breznakia pachnodae]